METITNETIKEEVIKLVDEYIAEMRENILNILKNYSSIKMVMSDLQSYSDMISLLDPSLDKLKPVSDEMLALTNKISTNLSIELERQVDTFKNSLVYDIVVKELI